MIWEILKWALFIDLVFASVCMVAEMVIVGRAIYYRFEIDTVMQLLITIVVSITPVINFLITIYDLALVLCTRPIFIAKTAKVMVGKYPDDVVKPIRTEDGEVVGYMIGQKDSDDNE